MSDHPARQTITQAIAWPAAGLLLFLAVWQLLSLRYPEFILPGPPRVLRTLVDALLTGSMLRHSAITLAEAVPGLITGALLALVLGWPIAHSRAAGRLLSPLIVASQGIPLIAVAPLIFLWFGSGLGAKILVCALITFFPIVINVIAGLRDIPPTQRDLFRMLRASRRDTFVKLEVPAALPFIFAGLRTAGALAMIGALTGEFISADRGLGFLINQAYGLYDTPLVMAAIVMTVLLALSLYGGLRWIELRIRRA